jgi:hypothetical protein
MLSLNNSRQTQNLLHLPGNKMVQEALIAFVCIALVAFSCTVYGSLQITAKEHTLMQYTKLISEEHFIAGLPLGILLPLAEEDSTSEELGYLIEELHALNRWPILVLNATYETNETTYFDIHQHGSYIILVSAPCQEWGEYISRFWEQLEALYYRENTCQSWNPTAKFVVSVLSNCTQFDNRNVSKSIFNELWYLEVMNATVLFLKSNEQGDDNVQQNITDTAKGTHLELHVLYPYENSESCNISDDTLPVKVLTAQSLKDIKKCEVFRGQFVKNSHGCEFKIYETNNSIYLYTKERDFDHDSDDPMIKEYEWLNEISSIILESVPKRTNFITNPMSTGDILADPFIILDDYNNNKSFQYRTTEFSRLSHTVKYAWYTPCAIKYKKWSLFFKIFSTGMWISFALSLILAVITVSCISNWRHKAHLQEFKSYSNIFSTTANVIAVSLSVSVNTQPRTAPLRVFFFCWVCYCVALSTVFQAYLSTFLIEPGYQEPIKTIDQMLNSKMKYGFGDHFQNFFNESLEQVHTNILKSFVHCPNLYTCLKWATHYRNFSTIVHDFIKEEWRAVGFWTDENKRPLLCELEDGDVANVYFTFLVFKGSAFQKYINDVIDHVVEAGIFMHVKKRGLGKQRIESKVNFSRISDTYYNISLRHLQAAFYLMMLGHALALACFVIEIIWHNFRLKVRELKSTSHGHRQTKVFKVDKHV